MADLNPKSPEIFAFRAFTQLNSSAGVGEMKFSTTSEA